MDDLLLTKELLNDGIILPFDKPLGWTSFYLLKKIRYYLCKQFNIKKLKIGHAGTLDPLATGLVILCTGKATKRIQELQEMPKEYITTMQLGATTPSFDLETKIDMTYPFDHITLQMIENKLKRFIGSIDQIPPLYSAKYIDGTRAYQYAREGIKKTLLPSKVEFYQIDLINYTKPFLTLKISCSKGTYIRAFARDLGSSLGSGAHLTELKRTAIGNYSQENAFNLESFVTKLYKL